MNTYKLKKVYPGLPKDWEIGIEVGLGCRTYGYSPCNGKYTNWYINNDIIENNPEFWEKVVEKDYEVLSYIKKDNSAITTKRENGFFLNSMFKDSHGVYSDYQLLNTWNIYSVKRLSDGEIFTVGDKIDCKGWFGNIIKFEIINNELKIFQQQHINSSKYKPLLIQDLIKVKQPLFKTEDGKEIYEGGKLHSVSKDLLISPDDNRYITKGFIPNLEYKHFSTKEKAEEYIIMNKPCLSINDVLSVGQRVIVDEGKLKQIVKSKI